MEENIKEAFRKPGIWPINGKEMIAKVSKPKVISASLLYNRSKTLKTLLNSRALR
jgi:hypothetical protein